LGEINSVRRPGEITARAFRSTFLRDAGALTVSNVVAAIIAVVQGVIVARWLGPRNYGVVALVTAYPAVALALLTPDSPFATVRYLSDRDAAADPTGALAVCKLAHLVDLAVGVAAFGGVAVTAGWAQQHVVHFQDGASLLILTAGAMAIAAPSDASTAVLLHGRRYRLLAIVQIAVAAGRAVLIIALVAAGQGPVGAVRGAAAAIALQGVATVVLASLEAKRRWGGWWTRPRTAGLGKLRREMLRFMAWTDVGALLGTVTRQFDVVILGLVQGPTEVGYYRLAQSIASLPGYLVGPLKAAVYPRLTTFWAARRREELRAAVRRHAVFGTGLAAAGLLALPALGVPVRAFAGQRYGPAIGVAQVLSVGSLLVLACYWLRPLYMATGEVRIWVAIITAVSAVSLAAFVLAGAAWGAMGIAIAQLAAAVIQHLALASRLGKMLAVNPADQLVAPIELTRP
jgi:O-antigen/teichoic acid export membrane protein